MKKCFKRMCCIVLALALALPICTFSASAAGTDTACALNSGELGLLKLLGVITADKPDFSAKVTRGELAQMMTKLCAIEVSDGDKVNGQFYDLDKTHKYYAQINACIGNGMFSGDGTGYFRPDDAVTFNEACKVFSVALGYKVVGYFSSYVDTARVSGITDGVRAEEYLTLGTAAEMAHNMLHAGMFETSVYGDEPTYKVKDNYTALEHYRALKRGSGILNGIYGTRLESLDSGIYENEVLIGGVRYTYTGGEALLGKEVVFYIGAHDESGKPEIQYIYADPDKNSELVIDAEDMLGKSGTTVSYLSGDKKKTVKFSDIGDVVINGVAHPLYDDADFKPQTGTVTLIDCDGDRVYDTAIIRDLKYMLVGAVDLTDRLIYDKNDSTNVLGDKDDDNVVLRLMRGENEAHLNIISEDSPVMYQKSRNTEGIVKINVYIPDETVSGIVGGIGDDYISIDGTRYTVSKNAVYDDKLMMGDTVDLSIFEGKVGAVVHKQDGYMYGYLVDAAKDGDSFSSTLSIMLVTTNRVSQVYECVENLKIDESVRRDIDVALNILRNTSAQTYQANTLYPYSQPIRYRVNTAGKLSHIDTLVYDDTKESEDSLRLFEGYKTRKFFTTSNSFYNTSDESLAYAMASTSARMIVPRKFKADDMWYGSGFSNNGNYVVEAFNVDPVSLSAKFVVAYTSNGESVSVSSSAVPYIVSSVEKTLNSEGAEAIQISYVGTNTAPVTKLLHSRIGDIDLAVGDVVRFNGGTTGELVALERLVQAGKVPTSRLTNYGTINSFKFLAPVRYAYGTVVSYKDDLLVITTSVAEDDAGVAAYENRMAFRNVSAVPVWIYDDARTPTVTQGTWNDIVSYEVNPDKATQVCICAQSGVLKFIYICE